MVIKRYLINILIAADQGINALAGGNPDETISSRAAKAQLNNKRWGCVLCKLLNYLDKDHCIKNIELDEV